MEMHRGYKFVPGKMFSGIKSDFSRVLLDSTNRDDLFHSVERNFCDVISLKVETQITSNFACLPVSSVQLLVPNFKSICYP